MQQSNRRLLVYFIVSNFVLFFGYGMFCELVAMAALLYQQTCLTFCPGAWKW
jgi:hypothetical protein